MRLIRRPPRIKSRLINGGFDADYAWWLGDGLAITGGVLVCTGGTGLSKHASQPFQFIPGRSYSISFDVVTRTAGTADFRLRTFRKTTTTGALIGTGRTTAGTFAETVVPTAEHCVIGLGGASAFAGTLDNLTITLL